MRNASYREAFFGTILVRNEMANKINKTPVKNNVISQIKNQKFLVLARNYFREGEMIAFRPHAGV